MSTKQEMVMDSSKLTPKAIDEISDWLFDILFKEAQQIVNDRRKKYANRTGNSTRKTHS